MTRPGGRGAPAGHRCAVPGCRTDTRGPRYLMCHPHWLLVPLVLQRTIWRLWNHGKPADGHREACQNAVEQVQAQLRDGVDLFQNPVSRPR